MATCVVGIEFTLIAKRVMAYPILLKSVHGCTYNRAVTFEWDEAKASRNLLKHGVAFADAVGVFEDPNALTIEDDDNDEARFVTLGFDPLGRLVVVVYTWRGDLIRIISARKATAKEEREYAEGM